MLMVIVNNLLQFLMMLVCCMFFMFTVSMYDCCELFHSLTTSDNLIVLISLCNLNNSP